MKRISVFCGSSMGSSPIFSTIAKELGSKLAIANLELVYGGSDFGLMGVVANGVLAKGGSVLGVLPTFLSEQEIAHKGLTKLYLVETMHERKKKMHDLCDGVIALPGGFGTLEELFEMLTWAQLGLHNKPIGLLNINGFYDELLKMLDTMVNNGFLKPIGKETLLVSDTIDGLLHKMNRCNVVVKE